MYILYSMKWYKFTDLDLISSRSKPNLIYPVFRGFLYKIKLPGFGLNRFFILPICHFILIKLDRKCIFLTLFCSISLKTDWLISGFWYCVQFFPGISIYPWHLSNKVNLPYILIGKYLINFMTDFIRSAKTIN